MTIDPMSVLSMELEKDGAVVLELVVEYTGSFELMCICSSLSS